MKLLPRPEAITGEVSCGQHKMSSAWRSDTFCSKPANHEGNCALVTLPYTWETVVTPGWDNAEYSKIKIDPKDSHSTRTSTQGMFDYLREMLPEYNWDEEENRFKYDGGGFKGPPKRGMNPEDYYFIGDIT